MGRPSPTCAMLPRRPSQSVAVHRLAGVSTPELAAELYRRLCVGFGGEPGPFTGTMLELYLKCLFEEPRTEGDAAWSPRTSRGPLGREQ